MHLSGRFLAGLGENFQEVESIDLVTRGLLWACDKLDADGKPKPGYEKK